MPNQQNKRDAWLWGILILAIGFRFALLPIKPPHSDEGVMGWFADQIAANGYYKYDPTNYHGPFHYYAVFFFKLLLGRNLWALRLPSAILGVGVVYLLAQFKPYVGRFSAYTVAVLAAVSPGLIYFSRFTFETDFLFFNVLAFLGYLRHAAARDRASLWMMGVGMAGMITVKEAFLFHLVTFGIAIVCLKLLARFVPSDVVEVEKKYTPRDVDVVCGVSLLIVVTFYSGFFMHAGGVVDLFKTYTTWVKTGTQGSGHDKPFFFWATLLARYEWPALVGLLVSTALVLRTALSLRLKGTGTTGLVLSLNFVPQTTAPLRLIGLYGFGLFWAYSLIPYKTPWLAIQLIWPLLFVFAAFLPTLTQRTGVAMGIVGLSAATLTYPAIRLNFFTHTDEKERYVYVQTFPALMEVYEKVAQRAESDPNVRHLPMNIIIKSNWPMPWLLGDYTHVGYHSTGVPENPDGAFLLVDVGWQEMVEQKLRKTYFTQRFRYSSYQEDVVAYFDAQVFADQFDAVTPVFKPTPLSPGVGLLARYYTNAQWQGTPVIEKRLANINLQIPDPPPAGSRPLPAPFSIVFSGELFIPEEGEIVFYLSSDDGAELTIDDQTLISDIASPAVRLESRGQDTLTAGWHSIQVRYFDTGGGILARLEWQLPSMAQKEVIPLNRLRLTEEGMAP